MQTETSEHSAAVRRNIFVDLDETLIHTLVYERFYPEPFQFAKDVVEKSFEDEGVIYRVGLRPGAHELLKQLRSIGEVYMLTRATLDYATAINKTFDLGFSEDRIFDRKAIKKGPYKNYGIPKGFNYLIDNLPSVDNFEKLRFMNAYGINRKYIKVPDFWGLENEGFTSEQIDEYVNSILNS